MLARPAHHPVLLAEVVAALEPATGKTFIDATFGRGGYTRGLLDAAPCCVIGVDRDPAAVAYGEQEVLPAYGAERFQMVRSRFGELARQITEPVDGIAFDLGVSSPQLDEAARGFSFQSEGPLDMRMDNQSGQTAADLVNTLAEADLARIIWEYGEERHSRRIARRIVEARQQQPFTTTRQLAQLVESVVPHSKGGKAKIHPATRTFQGLRIAVNEELQELEHGLLAAEKLLKPGGRLAVVSFHSLEDRIVKNFLNLRSGKESQPNRHQPARSTPIAAPSFTLLSRKAITPGDEETNTNPRARSARLRVAQRTDAPVWGGPGA